MGEFIVSNFTDSKINSFFTIPNNLNNLFSIPNSELKVYCALRKATFDNKNFLILTGNVKKLILSILSDTYSSFKNIRRIINQLRDRNLIKLTQSDLGLKIIFLENSEAPIQHSDPIQHLESKNNANPTPESSLLSANPTPPLYELKNKKDSKEDTELSKEKKVMSKNSFILNNSTNPKEKQQDIRMNESPLVKTIKPTIDQKYIKAIEQLPEFKKYKPDEQTSIHRFIHKAKTKNIDPTIIDDYCRSIIFNKTPSNMKNPKYKPILNIKNYSYAALFNNMSIYHKMDNPNFPFDTRTQDELKHEQRQKETIEKQTLEQQTSKAIENTQENFLTKLKYLQDLFKENFEVLLTKAKLAVARIKNYNPLFVPEIDAVEELYNNHTDYASAKAAC